MNNSRQCKHLHFALRFIGRRQLCPGSSKKPPSPRSKNHTPYNLKNPKNNRTTPRKKNAVLKLLKKISAPPNTIFKPPDLHDFQIAADNLRGQRTFSWLIGGVGTPKSTTNTLPNHANPGDEQIGSIACKV
jgi:hypothetical protein